MGTLCCVEALLPHKSDTEHSDSNRDNHDDDSLLRGGVTRASSPIRTVPRVTLVSSPRAPPGLLGASTSATRVPKSHLSAQKIVETSVQSIDPHNQRRYGRRQDDGGNSRQQSDAVNDDEYEGTDVRSPIVFADHEGAVMTRPSRETSSAGEEAGKPTAASLGLSNALKARLLRIELQVGETTMLAMQPITPGRHVTEGSYNNHSAINGEVESEMSPCTAATPQRSHFGNPLVAPVVGTAGGGVGSSRGRRREGEGRGSDRDDNSTATEVSASSPQPSMTPIPMPMWDTNGFYEEGGCDSPSRGAASPSFEQVHDRTVGSGQQNNRSRRKHNPNHNNKLAQSHQGNSSSTSANMGGSSTLSGLAGGSTKTPRGMRFSAGGANSLRSISQGRAATMGGSFTSVLSPLDAPNPSVLTAFPSGVGSTSRMSRFSVPDTTTAGNHNDTYTYTSSARGCRSVDAHYTNNNGGLADGNSSRLTMSMDFGDVMHEEDVDSRSDSDFEYMV
ncbi:Hypothetical protein, putative [Bodo saltans]|uniref:Uncharacterized protein n=1 Tax=Bodo saltans TaxID=75058 RepID=A0A0S4JTM9_BODSA|nr:Hypothetical protein, putative [Bodo saltans]|eukprot:CUG91900.1 Hypothetical protein, putative [Bodo saltans]